MATSSIVVATDGQLLAEVVGNLVEVRSATARPSELD
jgi:hypothetical protein